MKNESGYKTKFEQAEYKIVKNLNLNISWKVTHQFLQKMQIL